MAKNDIVLLESVLDAKRELAPSELREHEYFELFASDQVLKDYDLSSDELLDGLVGGGDDGGIDGMYTFADTKLLEENPRIASARDGIELHLVVVQAKSRPGFGEKPIQLIADTLCELLDLSRGEGQLMESGLFSGALIRRAEIFRSALTQVANRRPRVSIAIAYASKGDTAEISPKVGRRAERLEGEIVESISGAMAAVEFYGARELHQLSQKTRSNRLDLAFEGALPDEENSYVALVALGDYCGFLRDENGALRRYIFDGNVRDFQGNVEVNKEIAASLTDPDAPQFWWLNNGVTILASNVSTVGKRLFLDAPQIVNGLQTSVVIHETFPADEPVAGSDRRVLVRIIDESDPRIRDRIIRSTNSQTRVSTASLRATDELQREIEAYFLHADWFYDRRKNYWKNEGKPAERIVQITYLAQAVLAICLGDPSSARARPSSLLKADAEYKRIFARDRSYSIYLWAAKTQKVVDAFLRGQDDVTQEEMTNLKFHLSTLLVSEAVGRRVDSADPNDLDQLLGHEFSDAEMLAALARLRTSMERYLGQNDLRMDRAAKKSDFVQALLAEHFPAEAVCSV
ncbi:MAG TPA: AIPR family protein [Solirubrobacterales bacterium]|nr:AIPR family protein [Solirubrobacterales bacterium]